MAVKSGHSPSAGSDAIEFAPAAPLQLLQDAPIAPAGIHDPDHDLVEHARLGDRPAFEALLRGHYSRIHRIAWRMTGAAADADDIAQDVCCTLAPLGFTWIPAFAGMTAAGRSPFAKRDAPRLPSSPHR